MLTERSNSVWTFSCKRNLPPDLLPWNDDEKGGSAAGQSSTSFRSNVVGLALTTLLAGVSGHAIAQDAQSDGAAAARAGEIAHAQKMRKLFPDIGVDAQPTRLVIPELELTLIRAGRSRAFSRTVPR